MECHFLIKRIIQRIRRVDPLNGMTKEEFEKLSSDLLSDTGVKQTTPNQT
jgi:hypothetical protein